jgi:CspA family cold shock protein
MGGERLIGTVLWFNNSKGYGFIGREGAPDLFVHFSGIVSEGYKSLAQGDEVEYEVVPGANGRPQAASVVRIAQDKAA